jgi:hypothetical protein
MRLVSTNGIWPHHIAPVVLVGHKMLLRGLNLKRTIRARSLKWKAGQLSSNFRQREERSPARPKHSLIQATV